MLTVDAGAQLASYDSKGGLDGYWETIVCSHPVMRSGCHTASFTVVRGGRTLHVGVVRRGVSPAKQLAPSGNATDTSAGWGFDSESGGCVVQIAGSCSSKSSAALLGLPTHRPECISSCSSWHTVLIGCLVMPVLQLLAQRKLEQARLSQCEQARASTRKRQAAQKR